jgi:hypothetical protein
MGSKLTEDKLLWPSERRFGATAAVLADQLWRKVSSYFGDVDGSAEEFHREATRQLLIDALWEESDYSVNGACWRVYRLQALLGESYHVTCEHGWRITIPETIRSACWLDRCLNSTVTVDRWVGGRWQTVYCQSARQLPAWWQEGTSTKE